MMVSLRILLISICFIAVSPAFAEDLAVDEGKVDDECPDENEKDFEITGKKLKITSDSKVLEKIGTKPRKVILSILDAERRGCFSGVAVETRYNRNAVATWDSGEPATIVYKAKRKGGDELREDDAPTYAEMIKLAKRHDVVRIESRSYLRRPGYRIPRPVPRRPMIED